ncbi:hypothetical protein LXG21_00320, partial [Klebsiella pneumoniae]|uniref:hypothetical protein n=1 Tax=Klebsiella pneumoniae TaxID=573 RepID=UPI001F164EA6
MWQATNTGGSAGTVPVSIAGLTGQSVTLVYTNQSAAAQPMPSVSLSGVGLLNATGTPVPKTAADVAGNDANAAFDRQLSDFNIHALDGYATGAGPLKTQGASNNT